MAALAILQTPNPQYIAECRLNVDSATDVQALTSEGDDIIPSLLPAFERYNESQLTTVKLPGSSQEVRANDYLLSGGENADVCAVGRSLSVNSTRWKATGTLTPRVRLRSRSTIPHRYVASIGATALHWKLIPGIRLPLQHNQHHWSLKTPT